MATMKVTLSLFFSLLATLSYTQTQLRTASKGQMDSLMCPEGYAAVGKPYMLFKLSKNKKVIDNKSLKGKVVLINFWFEGCHPCMAEMSGFNELFGKLKDNRDFEFISISWDIPETINRVKNKYSLQFDVFSADTKECERLNMGCGYPTTIILTKEGIVKYRHSGGSTDEPKAKEFVMTTLLSEIEGLL